MRWAYCPILRDMIYSFRANMGGYIGKTDHWQEQLSLAFPYDQIADFCRLHHIRRPAFFGSTMRRELSRPDSDVNVLAESAPDPTPGLAFFAMQDELS